MLAKKSINFFKSAIYQVKLFICDCVPYCSGY